MADLTKQQFAISVRLYINHKRVLEKYSPWYKKDEIAKSMSRCYDLFRLVKRDCNSYNLEQLAKMVLINKNDLMMILPAPNNTSYERQKQKIESIIQTAKNILK